MFFGTSKDYGGIGLDIKRLKETMTNEERVEQYFAEIEGVFGTREQALNLLNNYDKYKKENDTQSVEILERMSIGRHHKEYWVKFEVKEPELLNNFMISWIVNGKSIAGVQGSVLDYGGVCNKDEIKRKMLKFIEEL